MPRNGPVFVSSKQVNTYMSPKSVPQKQKSVQSHHTPKAPAPRKIIAPPLESPAQCLQRLMKEVPADKQLTVAFRLFAVILINQAVLEAELQQEQQWAWLAEYEANMEQRQQGLSWEMGDSSADVSGDQQAEDVVQCEQAEAMPSKLEYSLSTCAQEPHNSKQQPDETLSVIKQPQEPVTITVFAIHPEELPSAAVEEVSEVTGGDVEDDSSNSSDVADCGIGPIDSSSSSGCVAVTSNASFVYTFVVASLTSIFMTMHLIRVAAYCTLAFTCYTAAAVDVALCTIADAEATAVAVASCNRLSRSMSSSFRKLASPTSRSNCDATLC